MDQAVFSYGTRLISMALGTQVVGRRWGKHMEA